jgi:hypothetical protein
VKKSLFGAILSLALGHAAAAAPIAHIRGPLDPGDIIQTLNALIDQVNASVAAAGGSGGVGTPAGSSGDIQINNGSGGLGALTPGANVSTWLGTPSGANLAAALTTALPATKGGTGLTSFTSGGVPYFSSTSAIASSSALTENLPVIGGGAGNPPTVGTRSGNTTSFATTTGTLTNDHYVKFDADGNLIDGGTGTGGSPLTTTDGTTPVTNTTTQTLGTGLKTTDLGSGNVGIDLVTVVNSQSGGSYTVQTSDANKIIRDSFSGGAVVFPAATSLGSDFSTVINCTGADGCILYKSVTEDVFNAASATLSLAQNESAFITTDGMHIFWANVLPGSSYDMVTTDGTTGVSRTTQQTFGTGFLVGGSAGEATVDLKVPLRTVTSNWYIMLPGDGGYDLIMTDASTSGGTLPQATTTASGWSVYTDCNAQYGCAWQPYSGDTINGSTSTLAFSNGTSLLLISDGTSNFSARFLPDKDPLDGRNIAYQRTAISYSWSAGQNPNDAVLYTATNNATITAIGVAVAAPVGVAGTIEVMKAPSGTACSDGTAQATGTIDANGTANTVQYMTLVTGAANTLTSDDRLCLVTTGTGWATGAGVGGLTIQMVQR